MNDRLSRKTFEMLRRFLADISDQDAGMWLVSKGRLVSQCMEQSADSLTKQERLKFYGLMEGFFPNEFKAILNAQMKNEKEPDCRRLLSAISKLHD